MTEKDVSKGLSIVIFFTYGIISIGSLYMTIKTFDIFYVIITSINAFIGLLLACSYLIVKLESDDKLPDDNIPDEKLPDDNIIKNFA